MKLQGEIKAILYLCAIPLLLDGCAPQVKSVNSRGPDAYAQKRAYEAQQRRLAAEQAAPVVVEEYTTPPVPAQYPEETLEQDIVQTQPVESPPIIQSVPLIP